MIERDAAAAAAGVDLNRVPNWRPAPPAEGEAPIGADTINVNGNINGNVFYKWKPTPSDLNDETARSAQTSCGRTGRETARCLVCNPLLVVAEQGARILARRCGGCRTRRLTRGTLAARRRAR